MKEIVIFKKVVDVQSGTSAKGINWVKTMIEVETEGRYPKTYYPTVFNNEEMVAKIPENTQCEIDIDIQGNEWQGKYYNNVNVFKITPVRQITPAKKEPAPVQTSQINDETVELDPLPF